MGAIEIRLTIDSTSELHGYRFTSLNNPNACCRCKQVVEWENRFENKSFPRILQYLYVAVRYSANVLVIARPVRGGSRVVGFAITGSGCADSLPLLGGARGLANVIITAFSSP